MNVGLIRVLTTEDGELLKLHGDIIEKNFPLKVESRCIADQYTGIHSSETYDKAIPKILRLGKEFEQEGKDGIIISCAADPGLSDLRKQLKIPVVGAGSAAASLALGFSSKIGVLNLTEDTPESIKSILGFNLIADIQVNAANTLELMAPNGLEDTLNSSLKLQKDGVDTIILACTGMSTIKAAEKIQEATGLLAIDPVLAEGLIMWSYLQYFGR